jgi:hypothetical protein
MWIVVGPMRKKPIRVSITTLEKMVVKISIAICIPGVGR